LGRHWPARASSNLGGVGFGRWRLLRSRICDQLLGSRCGCVGRGTIGEEGGEVIVHRPLNAAPILWRDAGHEGTDGRGPEAVFRGPGKVLGLVVGDVRVLSPDVGPPPIGVFRRLGVLCVASIAIAGVGGMAPWRKFLHPRKRRTRAPVLSGGRGAAPGVVASKNGPLPSSVVFVGRRFSGHFL